MRKYYRLILLVSSAFLFLLFLYYQLKYEQLRDVIQGMNVFGHRLADRECQERIASALSARLRFSQPAWTRVGEQVSIYSVFGSATLVQAVAIIRGIVSETDFGCEFWYPDQSVQRGRFSYVRFSLPSLASEGVPSLLRCEAIVRNATALPPMGISFHDSVRKYQTMSLILPLQPEQPAKLRVGICVDPLPPGYNDVFRLGEILAHYLLLGARYLVFYDQGVSQPVRQVFEYAATLNDSIHLLPWNIPSDLAYNPDLAFIDCYLRMTHDFNVSHVLKVRSGHFIKPATGNFTQFLGSLPPALRASPLRLHPVTFCMNTIGDIIAKGLHLPYITVNKVKQTLKDRKVFPMIFPTHLDETKVFQALRLLNTTVPVVAKSSAAVFQYLACTMREKSLVVKNEEMRNVGLVAIKTPLVRHIDKVYSASAFINHILP